MTTTEKNKAIYRSFIQQVFNEGRLDSLGDFLSPSYVYRDAPPGTPVGAEGIKQIVSLFRAAFPDLQITIEQQVAEDDLVCSRTTTRGTHKGEIFGMAATGKSVTVPGLTMVHVVDDRLVESWVKNDVIGLMKQLNADSPSK
jgi:predicted ester cyclase